MRAETGTGEIGQYVNHPLNWLRSEPLAHVLRGLTGMLAVLGVESLRLAVFDVLAGLFGLFIRPAKPPAGGEQGYAVP